MNKLISNYVQTRKNEGEVARSLAAELGCSVGEARKLLSWACRRADQAARDAAGLVKYTVECMADGRRWTAEFPDAMQNEPGTALWAWIGDCRTMAGRAVQVTTANSGLVQVVS